MSDSPLLDARVLLFKTGIAPAMSGYVGSPIDQTAIDAGNAALAAYILAEQGGDALLTSRIAYAVAADPLDNTQYVVTWSEKPQQP